MKKIELPLGRINILQNKINKNQIFLLEKIRKNRLAKDKTDAQLLLAISLIEKQRR